MTQPDYSDILEGEGTESVVARMEKHYVRHGYDKWRDMEWYKKYHTNSNFILESGHITEPPEPGSIKTLVLLQNAWIRCPHPIYRYIGVWPRDCWLAATAESPTGKKLSFMLERDDVWFDDSTPLVALGDSGGKHPPDLAHVRSLLNVLGPQVVVTCGTQAREIIETTRYSGRRLMLSHPGNRILTNKYWEVARRLFEEDKYKRNSVIQLKHDVVVV